MARFQPCCPSEFSFLHRRRIFKGFTWIACLISASCSTVPAASEPSAGIPRAVVFNWDTSDWSVACASAGSTPARIPVESIQAGKLYSGIVIDRKDPGIKHLMDTPWRSDEASWLVRLPERLVPDGDGWKIIFGTVRLSTATLNAASETPIVGHIPVVTSAERAKLADYTGRFVAFD